MSNDSSKKKKNEQKEEYAQEVDKGVKEPLKKKKKQMKEKKEREVDDNRSLKKNLNMGAEETMVMKGITKVQLYITVSSNGSEGHN